MRSGFFGVLSDIAATIPSQITIEDNSTATATAIDAVSQARSVKTEIELLRYDLERLLMITEALWTLIKEDKGYSDEQLLARVQAIDVADGKLDGKVAKSPPKLCPHCGRTLFKKRQICLYCGQQVNVSLFER
jgi:hypothetical protein